MNHRSKYDLTPEYRTKLVGLINDALDVYRQYEYAEYTDGAYSISYKRNRDWFLEGLLPRIQDEKRGVNEHEKLRKGTKNYYSIFFLGMYTSAFANVFDQFSDSQTDEAYSKQEEDSRNPGEDSDRHAVQTFVSWKQPQRVE